MYKNCFFFYFNNADKSDHDSLKGNSETDNLIGDDSGSKHDDTDG